jgi:hypothetical protein
VTDDPDLHEETPSRGDWGYSRSHRRAGIGNCFLKSQPTAFYR